MQSLSHAQFVPKRSPINRQLDLSNKDYLLTSELVSNNKYKKGVLHLQGISKAQEDHFGSHFQQNQEEAHPAMSSANRDNLNPINEESGQ